MQMQIRNAFASLNIAPRSDPATAKNDTSSREAEKVLEYELANIGLPSRNLLSQCVHHGAQYV